MRKKLVKSGIMYSVLERVLKTMYRAGGVAVVSAIKLMFCKMIPQAVILLVSR